ncbi:hypothetical protein N9P45_00780 [bacterium]|nr:hypothetical protein [bacterium]
MFGRGLFRRLVVLVVLTLVTAVVVPGVMAPSAAANGCGGFTFEVADIDGLDDAIGCYNGQSPAGDYTITLTSDIDTEREYSDAIDSDTNSGDLTIDGAGYRIFGDGDNDYHLAIENEGTGTVYIKNITFTGADDDSIQWDGGNLDVRDSFFIDNELDIYGGPSSGPGGDLTLVNVVFSIGENYEQGEDPINITWDDSEALMTVIICNSSFDVNGDPSIEIDADGGIVDLYLANNVFNSDNDFELEGGVTVIDDQTPDTCQADEPTGSAAAVPYPGPFTQMPELAGAPYGWGTSPVPAASPETPTAAAAAGDGVAGLAYTGTTTTTLAYLAVGLIGFGALLAPVSRRRN